MIRQHGSKGLRKKFSSCQSHINKVVLLYAKRIWKRMNISFPEEKREGEGGKDGGGIGREDHFLPHKFLKRTFQRRANSTKQLL